MQLFITLFGVFIFFNVAISQDSTTEETTDETTAELQTTQSIDISTEEETTIGILSTLRPTVGIPTTSYTQETTPTPLTTYTSTPSTTKGPTTSARPTLDTSSRLSPYWVQTVVQLAQTSDAQNQTIINTLETKLLNAYQKAYDRRLQSNVGRRRKRAAILGDKKLQVVLVRPVANSNNAAFVYYVQQAGVNVPAATVVANMNLLSQQELAIALGVPVSSIAQPYESASGADKKLWRIGAVLGSLAAIVFIIWLVLFVYSRCLRPSYLQSPWDNEESKLVAEQGYIGPGQPMEGHMETPQVYRYSHSEWKQSPDRSKPVQNGNMTYLADEIARRIAPDVSYMVDERLRHPSRRRSDDSWQTPSEDDYVDQRRERRHRRRANRASVSPSEDDEIQSRHLPKLQRTKPPKKERSHHNRRHEKNTSNQRDIDRVLGAPDVIPEVFVEPKKSRRSERGRQQEPDEESEMGTSLRDDIQKMEELLATNSRTPSPRENGDVIVMKEVKTVESSAPPLHATIEEGDLLEPKSTPRGSRHTPIHVRTSFRPDAIRAAQLSAPSGFEAGDMVAKLQHDIESAPPPVPKLNLQEATPRTPQDSGRTHSRLGLSRPGEPMQASPRLPGAPLPSERTDEVDIASDPLPKGTASRNLIRSIREELQGNNTQSAV